METMKIQDILLLIATGLVALYLIWRFVQHYRSPNKNRSDIYYSIAFAVLLIAGLLLVFLGYATALLDPDVSPWVIIVSVLIPVGISLGLVTDLLPKYEKPYLAFGVVGLAAIAVTRFVGPAMLATTILIIVHAVAGLIIFGLPIWAVGTRKAPGGFIGVTVGGLLIGIGGIALASLKTAGTPLFGIFDLDTILLILAPLLLLMTLAYTWGFVTKLVKA